MMWYVQLVSTLHTVCPVANSSQFDANLLTSWQCEMAQTIRDTLSSGILVTTGGGQNLDDSLLDGYFSCDALDLLAIHVYYYAEFDTDRLTPYITQAQNAGKMLIMEEWGACYWDTENNVCSQDNPLDSGTRDQNIENWAGSMTAAGLPWMYWQILPNEDPHQSWDYEIGIGGVNWDTLKSVAAGTNQSQAAFDFSPYLS